MRVVQKIYAKPHGCADFIANKSPVNISYLEKYYFFMFTQHSNAHIQQLREKGEKQRTQHMNESNEHNHRIEGNVSKCCDLQQSDRVLDNLLECLKIIYPKVQLVYR